MGQQPRENSVARRSEGEVGKGEGRRGTGRAASQSQAGVLITSVCAGSLPTFGSHPVRAEGEELRKGKGENGGRTERKAETVQRTPGREDNTNGEEQRWRAINEGVWRSIGTLPVLPSPRSLTLHSVPSYVSPL